KKVAFVVGAVTPDSFGRPVSGARLVNVGALGINGQNNLVHGGVRAVRPIRAIIEDEHVTRAGQPRGNPMGVVLEENLLVADIASAEGARIAPPIKQIAALALFAAHVTGGLRCRGAVVDDPKLAEAMDADHDLVQFGMVGEAVEVVPVGAPFAA